jgi:uncharacterized iron-regulated membrane protein
MMYVAVEQNDFVAAPTFGRDAAMFHDLLGFMAEISLILWTLVVVTAVIRFIACRVYRRSSARAVEAGVAVHADDPAATAAPANVVAPVGLTAPASAAALVSLVTPGNVVTPVGPAVRDNVVAPVGALYPEGADV